MQLDRGIQAAGGIVLAFSMLFTITIMVPDHSSSVRSLGISERSAGTNVVHAHHPRILRNTKRKIRIPYKRALIESNEPSATQLQPMTATSQPVYTETQNTQRHQSTRMFPAYIWYLTVLVLYKSRNIAKKRSRRQLAYADEAFFQKSGLESSLGYGLNYENPNDDIMSVNSSYGSLSQWTPDSLNKFDLELEFELSDSQI